MTMMRKRNCQVAPSVEDVVSAADCFSGDFIAGDSVVWFYLKEMRNISASAHFWKMRTMQGCTVLTIITGGLQQAGGARPEWVGTSGFGGKETRLQGAIPAAHGSTRGKSASFGGGVQQARST